MGEASHEVEFTVKVRFPLSKVSVTAATSAPAHQPLHLGSIWLHAKPKSSAVSSRPVSLVSALSVPYLFSSSSFDSSTTEQPAASDYTVGSENS
jgi:hypothetical protein